MSPVVRASASTALPRVDVDLVLRSLPVLVGRLRALTFDVDGALVVDGVRHEGVRLTGGRHPEVAARYLLSDAGPAHAGNAPQADCELELVANDSRHLTVTGRSDDVGFAIGVQDPGRSTRLTGALDARPAQDGWWNGPFTAEWRVDLPSARTDTDLRGAATFVHRRARGRASLRAVAADAGRLRVDLDASVRARGVLWLVGPLASLLPAKPLQRALQRALGTAAGAIEDLLRSAAGAGGYPTPDECADEMLERIVGGGPSGPGRARP